MGLFFLPATLPISHSLNLIFLLMAYSMPADWKLDEAKFRAEFCRRPFYRPTNQAVSGSGITAVLIHCHFILFHIVFHRVEFQYI